jgi:nucleoid-associated protein YgaU
VSLRRLALTATVMAAIAVLLRSLAPGIPEAMQALAQAQRTVDSSGADAVLLSAVGLAAWFVWGWGALGLAMTAVSAAPGVVGGAARAALRVLLPAGARRGAALALGIGLGMAAPVLVDAPAATERPALAVAVAAAPTAVPDWPSERPADSHVVVRGDCLWDIAAGRLAASGASVTDAAVADAVQAWWSANADVIGPDPDLLLPGQVLRAPQG